MKYLISKILIILSFQIELLESGDFHSCQVHFGILYCWGFNNEGQIDIPLDIKTPITNLGLGEMHSCAISDKSELRCWGWGQLNQTETELYKNSSIIQVEAGSSHTCALEINGNFHCFGCNSQGQTVINIDEKEYNILNFSLGDDFTCVIKVAINKIHRNPELVCFGSNKQGQTDVPNFFHVNSINLLSCGYGHVCIQPSIDHPIVCWGLNHYGQCDSIKNTYILDLASGADFSCVLQNDNNQFVDSGMLDCWGLPIQEQYDDISPRKGVFKVAAGFIHICQVWQDDDVSCIGSNDYRQLEIPSAI